MRNIFKRPMPVKHVLVDKLSQSNKDADSGSNESEELQKINKISKNVQENKKIMQDRFRNSLDVVFYEFKTISGIKALVVYIDELAKKETLDRDVINPFILESNNGAPKPSDEAPNYKSFNDFKKLFPVTNTLELSDFHEVVNNILAGNTVVFIESMTFAISIACRGWEKREIQEPMSEMVVRGPKEGFIESININRALIRRKIRNENLVFESMEIGRQTKTVINIVYIDGIVSKDVLNEVRRRLAKIDVDSILDAGNIEEYIEDSHISPVSTVANTQKPDVVAAKILEGRVGIMCDGSPHVLTVPHLFIETIQTSEDYYNRPYIATLLRIIRLLALAVSVLFPAVYVSLETFHQDMIPSVFLITTAGANVGTPFPAFLEALIMVTAFEFLKESGTRMPKAIGSAISIVGALVLGDAAVKAGIISADLIVVIAFTAVATFIIPSLNEVVTLYRLFLLILSGIMGIYGVTAGVFMIVIHANSLRSFGVPFMSPISPINLEGLKDSAIRFPFWSMSKRPSFISGENKTRRGNM